MRCELIDRTAGIGAPESTTRRASGVLGYGAVQQLALVDPACEQAECGELFSGHVLAKVARYVGGGVADRVRRLAQEPCHLRDVTRTR